MGAAGEGRGADGTLEGTEEMTMTIWYGPHACARCGKIIAKEGHEFGGREVDYPKGPIYPNTQWPDHLCRGPDLSVEAQSAREDIANCLQIVRGLELHEVDPISVWEVARHDRESMERLLRSALTKLEGK